jgi:hypothetical protein
MKDGTLPSDWSSSNGFLMAGQWLSLLEVGSLIVSPLFWTNLQGIETYSKEERDNTPCLHENLLEISLLFGRRMNSYKTERRSP